MLDSDCPLSSASFPGKAPAVSTKDIKGNLNFLPILISELFYILLVCHSKLCLILVSIVLPFPVPIKNRIPSIFNPPTIALSSAYFLSPCKTMLSNIFFI